LNIEPLRLQFLKAASTLAPAKVTPLKSQSSIQPFNVDLSMHAPLKFEPRLTFLLSTTAPIKFAPWALVFRHFVNVLESKSTLSHHREFFLRDKTTL
jgi:hypothetical protein